MGVYHDTLTIRARACGARSRGRRFCFTLLTDLKPTKTAVFALIRLRNSAVFFFRIPLFKQFSSFLYHKIRLVLLSYRRFPFHAIFLNLISPRFTFWLWLLLHISSLAFENGFNSLATFYRVLKQYKQQLPHPKNIKWLICQPHNRIAQKITRSD